MSFFFIYIYIFAKQQAIKMSVTQLIKILSETLVTIARVINFVCQSVPFTGQQR